MKNLSFNEVREEGIQTVEFEHLPNTDPPTILETFVKPHTVATRAVSEDYPMNSLFFLVKALQAEANAEGGIDYLQRFNANFRDRTEEIWVIDDGGAVTVLYPSDY